MCTRLQEYFGATKKYINMYRAVFRAALDGDAPAMVLDARKTSRVSTPLSVPFSELSVPSS